MMKNYVVLALAGLLPMGFAMSAHAQVAVVPAAADAAGYSLKSSTLKSADSSAQQIGAVYELSGTSISGTSGASDVILTAPVAAGAAAYKTESGLYFYPSVFVGAGHNDNVQSAATNVVASSFTNISPQVVAEFKYKGDRYTALASLDNTRYASSSADNYTNSEIQLAGDNYFSSRARAGWSIGQVNGSDPRGVTNIAASASPDRWHSVNVNGRVIYGAPEASGRLEFDVGHQEKTYDNNRDNTAAADLNVNSYAARGFYRLGSKSLALVEFRQAFNRYNSALSTDSNNERRYYAGLTWEATAATTGIVKIGRMTKDFDLASKVGFSGASWETTVRWLPKTYSAFDLTTTRYAADTTGYGSFVDKTSTDLVWNHQWTQSLTSRLSAGVLHSDYGDKTRKDKATNYSLTVDYAVLRWLKVGVDFATTDNVSNDAALSYKRNVSMLTLNATL